MHSLIDCHHFDAFFEADADADTAFGSHLISANFHGTTLISDAVKNLNILEQLLQCVLKAELETGDDNES